MSKEPSNFSLKNLFFLLIGALFYSALVYFGDGGYVYSDVLLFSFAAFIVSLTTLYFLKTAVVKPGRISFAYQPMISRKDLTHNNDPLLM